MGRTTFMKNVYCAILFMSALIDASEFNTKSTSGAFSSFPSDNSSFHRRQKRQEFGPYYPDYPEPLDLNDYQGPNTNYIVPAGIAGGTALALKAAKTKAKLKGLLAVPAGIALLGGIAALASGVLPPAVIGGINLPFQGKRRKRNADYDAVFKSSAINRRKLLQRKQAIVKRLFSSSNQRIEQNSKASHD